MRPRFLLITLPVALLVGAPVARAQDPAGFLYGTVITESGTEYRGFLRWGTQEAFWDDLFHSRKDELPHREVADKVAPPDRKEERSKNRVRVFNFKIEWDDTDFETSRVFVARFGDIEQIEVTDGESARIHLRNGEVQEVTGYSDDVGGTIHVLDEKAGAIELKWDRIESIRFAAVPRSADPGVRRLFGTLETSAGRFEGYVTWDKEECTSADLLDGESEDGKVSVPMGEITSIERRGRRASIVELQDGRELRLRGTNDVNSDNRGIMIEDERFGKVTVPWDEFDRLELRTAPGSGRGYDAYAKPAELRGRVTDRDGRSLEGRIVFDLDEASTWEMLNGRISDIEFDIPFANIASIQPDGSDTSIVVLRNGERLELEDSQDVSESNDGLLVYVRGADDPTYLAWEQIDSIEFDR